MKKFTNAVVLVSFLAASSLALADDKTAPCEGVKGGKITAVKDVKADTAGADKKEGTAGKADASKPQGK